MRRFSTALQELEAAVTIPVVVGELGDWCRGVEDRSVSFERTWTQQREGNDQIFVQICRDDPALFRRVALMRAREDKLLDRYKALRLVVSTLRRCEDEPHGSWEPRTRGRELRLDLLRFSVACRALESEVSFWLSESLYRDRGVAD